jgi:hypothetical protein
VAIFGTSSPKITSGATTINLDYAIVTKNEPDDQSFVLPDTYAGSDGHVARGYHWDFEVTINIFKEADPAAMYVSLIALLGTKVHVFPHRDHSALSDALGNPVEFLFSELAPQYVTETFDYDALALKFKSLGFVDLSQSLS